MLWPQQRLHRREDQRSMAMVAHVYCLEYSILARFWSHISRPTPVVPLQLAPNPISKFLGSNVLPVVRLTFNHSSCVAGAQPFDVRQSCERDFIKGQDTINLEQ